MKRVAVTLAVLLFLSLTFAPFCFANRNNGESNELALEAGAVEISVGFNSFVNNSTLPTPYVGYFITNELEVGGSFMFSVGKEEGDSYNALALNPLARFHILSQGSKAVPFVEAGLQIISINRNTGDYDMFAITLGGGLRIFLDKNVSVNVFADLVVESIEKIDATSIRGGVSLSAFIF